MIPDINILNEAITEEDYGNETYKIKIINNESSNYTSTSVNGVLGSFVLGASELGGSGATVVTNDVTGRIDGLIDGIDAITQSIYLILSTERYAYLIYSWDYGVELIDLYGKPMSYVMSELPRRIEEALKTDDRIESVKDFEFEQKGRKLLTTFTVVTTVGNLNYELEVEV